MRHDAPDLADIAPSSLQFKATPMATRTALAQAQEAWLEAGIDADLRARWEQVLAEVLNNVVEHAFADKPNGHARLITRVTADGLQCEVMDNGVAMPDGQLPKGELAPLSDDINDLPEGGFGWFMIYAMTQDLTYQRKSGWNHLKFTIVGE